MRLAAMLGVTSCQPDHPAGLPAGRDEMVNCRFTQCDIAARMSNNLQNRDLEGGAGCHKLLGEEHCMSGSDKVALKRIQGRLSLCLVTTGVIFTLARAAFAATT